MYDPDPIDTSGIELPVDLVAEIERIAETPHDLWAKQRLADGWTWGVQRDDSSKQHPCLVPYAELPESERAYDRKIALETLRTIVALGYRIAAPDGNE